MNCRKAKTLLIHLMGEDLAGEAAAEVRRHLRECPACRREWDLLVKSWELLDGYETPPVSHGFARSVMRRLGCETRVGVQTRHTPRWRFASRLLSGLAACLAAVATAGLLWQHLVRHDGTRGVPPAPVVPDEEIVRDLDVYENLDLLQRLSLLADLDVVERLDRSSLTGDAKRDEE